ncbi:MAG: phosphatidylserine decarboxylase [Alphaproteobacteria bacterium 16-39-46]|nr:MAG: phosphatidylserine decarboxylase [Alphaproteobacteria bacterium 16-39-46]OZA42824.1 MAG: phosphatidylserine decarboxylase [Alphaproteobacteria bacterium 17-39-52]HQS84270.1 phosphatidylserine decarboxylase family protein [Alphaproteobacteria bacterium]HQS94114.1 phosphatidylserine decarboxylase family protein [Alphaproteobacteria bacterium]
MNLISFKIHKAGWPFIGIFALVALIFYSFSHFLGVVGFILTLWCLYFFRDPDRVVPTKESLILSPADGHIQAIEMAPMPKELGTKGEFLRISIFLNIFDVHVNRVPVSGILLKSVYHAGQFLNASLDKASDLNERHSYLLKVELRQSKLTTKIAFVQIAGLIARRILSTIEEGDRLIAGERFGMIRFGSRMDVYLPLNVAPLVCVGQYVLGGETPLADLTSEDLPREGLLK